MFFLKEVKEMISALKRSMKETALNQQLQQFKQQMSDCQDNLKEVEMKQIEYKIKAIQRRLNQL